MMTTPNIETVTQRLLPAALAILVWSMPASADSVIKMDVGVKGERHVSTAFVDAGRVAITQSNMNGHMFFDQASNTVTMVDHAQKSFVRLDEAKIERMVGMASGVMGAMAAALESLQNLPEDQRKAAEDVVKNMGLGNDGKNNKRSVQATGELRSINGIRCTMHNVMNNGAAVSQACVATAKSTGIPEQDWKTIESMRGLWLRFADRAMPLIERFGAGVPDISAIEVEGLPVLLIRGGKPEMMVRSVSRGKTPSDLVRIPQGYRERNLPLM